MSDKLYPGPMGKMQTLDERRTTIIRGAQTRQYSALTVSGAKRTERRAPVTLACTDCLGRGFVLSGPCDVCNGTGKVGK